MARNEWIGNAQGIAHVIRAVPSGFGAGSILDLIINNKRMRFQATSDSVAKVVAGWKALIDDSDIPEWDEVSVEPYIDDLQVTRGLEITGPDDGTPLVITESTTAAPIEVLVTTIQTGVPGRNHIQRLALQNTPTGGTFTITYNGLTTGAIAYNASNGTIQTALEGLTGIGASNVSVTGSTGLWYVEFIGTLAQTTVNPLTASGASLTGACSVRVDVVTEGSAATNYKQDIVSDTTEGLDLTATINLYDVVVATINITAGMSGSYLESVLAAEVGAANVKVTELGGVDGEAVFTVEWQGIYSGTDNAELVYVSGVGSIEENTPPNATGTNEVQLIQLLGGPTGGTFTLSFRGSTTAGQAYNASAATIQSALQGLATIGASNATVAASTTPAGYLVTFAASLGSQDVPKISGSGASLTGANFSVDPNYQTPRENINEKQQISFSTEPSSGNFTLTFAGQTTSNIAYNASASTIQTELIALSTIGASEVSVTGSALGPFIVEFLLTLGGVDVSEMTGTNVSLAGAGTEDIDLTEITAATGPHHWDNTANWSAGTIPVDGETVVLDGPIAIKYGLSQSGVDPALIVVRNTFTGGLGLPDRNEADYEEFRTKELSIGTSATLLPIVIGEGDLGNGCPLFRLNAGSAYPNIRILNTATNGDTPAVLLRGGATGTGNRVELLKGSLGFCYTEAETGTIKNLVVAFVNNKNGDANYELGSGATVTQITQSGGFGVALCTGHKVKLSDGIFEQQRSGWTIAEWIQEGGSASFIGSGTVSGTAKLSGEAELALLHTDQNISFANPIAIYGDKADLLDPHFRAIITGQVYMERDYINTTRLPGVLSKNKRIRETAL